MFCLVLVYVTNEYSSVCVLVTHGPLGPCKLRAGLWVDVLYARIGSDGLNGSEHPMALMLAERMCHSVPLPMTDHATPVVPWLCNQDYPLLLSSSSHTQVDTQCSAAVFEFDQLIPWLSLPSSGLRLFEASSNRSCAGMGRLIIRTVLDSIQFGK